jgi:hypothetical protein
MKLRLCIQLVSNLENSGDPEAQLSDSGDSGLGCSCYSLPSMPGLEEECSLNSIETA